MLSMLCRTVAAAAVVAILGVPGAARALSVTYQLDMTGADTDGSATGLLTLDDASGEVSWSFSYINIATPTAMHIHGPEVSLGSGGGIWIGLGANTTGGDGTLINSIVSSDLDRVAAVLADPERYYVNVHNSEFGAGAVRGQLGTVATPEPAALALLALAGVAALAVRRRA